MPLRYSESFLTRPIQAGRADRIRGAEPRQGPRLTSARTLVDEGAHVFITGRRQAEPDKAKDAIGRNVTTIQGDVANLGDLDRLYAIVKEEKGALDIVVASAGFVERRATAVATPEHFDKTFNINARGVYFTVQKALRIAAQGRLDRARVVLPASDGTARARDLRGD